MGSTGVPGITPAEAPEWLLDATGRPRTCLPPMDTSDGKIHLITCTGIGDVSWVYAKFWSLCEGRDVTWWFPDAGPYNRIEPYCRLMGMKYGGLLQIDTRDILEKPGQWGLADFEQGGVFFVHANRHIESGAPLHEQAPGYFVNHEYKVYDSADPNSHRLHYRRETGRRATWCPDLPFKVPTPPVTLVGPGDRPPQTSVNEGVFEFTGEAAGPDYVVVHMASPTYCEGNWFPRHWAKLIEHIEATYLPVKLIGAKWDEEMMDKVCEHYEPSLPACIGQSLGTALTAIVNAKAMVAVDSGLSIMASYYGKPVLRAYPRWLHLMPGTFEDVQSMHSCNRWCFMDELMEFAPRWLKTLGLSALDNGGRKV